MNTKFGKRIKLAEDHIYCVSDNDTARKKWLYKMGKGRILSVSDDIIIIINQKQNWIIIRHALIQEWQLLLRHFVPAPGQVGGHVTHPCLYTLLQLEGSDSSEIGCGQHPYKATLRQRKQTLIVMSQILSHIMLSFVCAFARENEPLQQSYGFNIFKSARPDRFSGQRPQLVKHDTRHDVQPSCW